MIQKRTHFDVHPPGGRSTVKISEEDARKALLEVIATELDNGAGWQDAKTFLSRPGNRSRAEKLDVYGFLGDAPQALIIDPKKYYNMRQLPEKLEAALIMAHVLRRSGKHAFNGGVLHDDCVVLVNEDGARDLEHSIQQHKKVQAAPGR